MKSCAGTKGELLDRTTSSHNSLWLLPSMAPWIGIVVTCLTELERNYFDFTFLATSDINKHLFSAKETH